MTVLEFEAWISDNYEELVARACHVYVRGRVGAEDLLHETVEHLLENEQTPNGDPMGFMWGAMRNRLKVWRRDAAIHARLDADLAESIKALGPDAFADTRSASSPIRKAAVARGNRKLRDKARAIQQSTVYVEDATESAASNEVRIGHLFYGQMGDTRWRFQTLRDNRLFDERAVRSLADSMHKASQAYRHFGEHGFAFSEFGQGVAL